MNTQSKKSLVVFHLRQITLHGFRGKNKKNTQSSILKQKKQAWAEAIEIEEMQVITLAIIQAA